MRKKFVPEKGVLLDANFLSHVINCDQCKRYEADKPATLALQCLEGSVLWKRENAVGGGRVDSLRELVF